MSARMSGPANQRLPPNFHTLLTQRSRWARERVRPFDSKHTRQARRTHVGVDQTNWPRTIGGESPSSPGTGRTAAVVIIHAAENDLPWGASVGRQEYALDEAQHLLPAGIRGMAGKDTATAITTRPNAANIGQRWRNSTALMSRGVGNGCREYRSIASSSVLMLRLALRSVYRISDGPVRLFQPRYTGKSLS